MLLWEVPEEEEEEKAPPPAPRPQVGRRVRALGLHAHPCASPVATGGLGGVTRPSAPLNEGAKAGDSRDCSAPKISWSLDFSHVPGTDRNQTSRAPGDLRAGPFPSALEVPVHRDTGIFF